MAESTAGGSTVASVGAGLYQLLLVTTRRADLAQNEAIGTDHLLAGLMLAVRPLQAVFDPPGPDVAAALSRRTRAGWRAATTASTSAGWEALGALREAHWNATVGWPRPRRIAHRSAPAWEQEVQEAVERALHHALAQGRGWAGEADLFAGLLDDPGNRAGDFLRENRVDRESARARIDRVWPDRTAGPRTPIADVLRKMGVLTDPAAPDAPTGRGGRFAARVIPLFAGAGPLLAELERQTVVQAIRVNQRSVTSAHLVLAVLAYEQQLRVTGLRPTGPAAAGSRPVLLELGASYPDAPGVAARIEAQGPPAPARKGRAVRARADGTQWTEAAADACDRARAAGGRRGVGAGSLHLLRAALTGTDDTGRRLLTGLGLDPERVLTAVGTRLGDQSP